MEGIVAKHILLVQDEYHALLGEGQITRKWASQLVCPLLEVVYGQWVYRNIQVHDDSKGLIWMSKKELIQWEIEIEMALGFDGFWRWIGCWQRLHLKTWKAVGVGTKNIGS